MKKIGKILQDELDIEGRPSLQDFASMLGISYRTLFHVFKDESKLTFDQVVKASEILNTDLIGIYLKNHNKQQLFKEPDIQYSKIHQGVSLSLTITGDPDSFYKNFSNLFKTVVQEAEKHGFTLK